MKGSSLFKRTLVVTGLLLGASAAWITLVSVTLVTVVDHAVSSGRAAPATAIVAPSAPSLEGGAAKRKSPTTTPPARGTTPNG